MGIQEGVFTGQDMVVGVSTNICMNAAMVACRADAEAAAGGPIDNVTDLQCFLDSNPGIDVALDLAGNTVEDIYDSWATDAETNEGFFLRTFCVVEGAMKLAPAASAMTAAYYAM